MYRKINKEFNYPFTVKKDGLYTVSIEASCKSGKILGLFGGEDLRIEIDGIKLREVPAKHKPQYYDIPPSWNGTKLKGFSKTVIFILSLAKGEHVVTFVPKRGATINKEPEITVFDAQNPVIKNIQAQDGNRRPWIAIALIDVPLKAVDIAVRCEQRHRDSDDAKLIIDGETRKNEKNRWWGKYWYWQGRDLQGSTKEARFYSDAQKGIHYIELWADRMPVLESLHLNIGASVKSSDDTEEDEVVLRPYTYRGVSGNENYNRYDTAILAAVDYWNGQFLKDTNPPEEPLDPNLVKAMIYVESRVGYYPGGEVDVIQVGNPGDDALRTLNYAVEETWFQNGKRIPLDYHGAANADTPVESIKWGVRWLYHKAQGIRDDGSRYWRSWQEAMEGYGPQREEHNKAIWNIYKNGVDTRENKSIRLWSFALLSVLLMLLLPSLSLFTFAREERIAEPVSVDDGLDWPDLRNEIDANMANALAEYQKKPDSREELFSPLCVMCERDGFERTLIADYMLEKYINDLVAHIASPKQLLEILTTMDLLEPHTWEYQDIDNDGEKELVLVDLDMAGHNFLDLMVIDVIDGVMESFSKRFEDYQYFGSPDSALSPLRPLRLLDITGDLIPEILIFGSWGRMGTRLRIVQYDNGVIEDKEFVRDFTYPVYTFYDVDNDGVLEISVSGDDPCSFGVYEYSCGSMYRDAIIKYDKATDSFVYNPI